MTSKLKRNCGRATLYCFEALAIITALMLMLVMLAGWRLLSGPVEISALDKTIQSIINDNTDGLYVSYDDILLEWLSVKEPLQIRFKELSVRSDKGTMAVIPSISVDLTMRQLFSGGIKPVNIKVDKPLLHLIRLENGSFNIAVQPEGQNISQSVLSIETIAEKKSEEKLSYAGILDQVDLFLAENKNSAGIFSALEKVEMTDAHFTFMDMTLDKTHKRSWVYSPVSATLLFEQGGLESTLVYDAVEDNTADGDQRFEIGAKYTKLSDTFTMQAFVQNFNLNTFAPKHPLLSFLTKQDVLLNGSAKATLGRNFDLKYVDFQLVSEQGKIIVPDIYNDPLSYEMISLQGSYDEKNKVLIIKQGRLKAADTDINVSAEIDIYPGVITAPILISIPHLEQKNITRFWPDTLRGDNAETWLVHNLSEGSFYDLEFSTVLEAMQDEGQWQLEAKDTKASFNAKNMTVDYRTPMTSVSNASGYGTYENDDLRIAIDSGQIGAMQISEASIILDELVAIGGFADIKLKLSGTFKDVIQYVSKEPISLSDEKLTAQMGALRGQTELDVSVVFPAIAEVKTEDVKVDVKGTLTDAVLPKVFEGLDLTGGPFALMIKDDAVSMSGKGALGGHPIEMSWDQYIQTKGKPYESRVKAKLSATPELRRQIGLDLDDWLQGTVPIDLVYTSQVNGKSMIQVNGDLKGASVIVDFMNYKKEPKLEGVFDAVLLADVNALKEISKLSIETEDFMMRDARMVFEEIKGEPKLVQGKIPSVILHETDVSADFEIFYGDKEDVLKVSASGAFFDARPFLSDKRDAGISLYEGKERYQQKAEAPMAVQASLQVERMRTHTARMIENAKIYAEINAQDQVNQFEMDARAGSGDIYLRLKPNDQGIMSLRLEAGDAGALLQAFDLYDNMRGGNLVMYGEAASIDTPRIIKGNLEITDFKVIQAPILARIVNALNPVGITELLRSKGIAFERLMSKFEWVRQAEGDIYKISDGKTKGPSIGLTFDGQINEGKDTVDVSGTIVPVSGLNRVVGNIPLIGNILSGGKDGALIAATYKVKGRGEETEVSVNPLAALAPGILRKILFEDDPNKD